MFISEAGFTTVNVIDAPMGFGKTSAMINYINASSKAKKFIFVTPFLDESERIKSSCPERDFQLPEGSDGFKQGEERKSKLVDFKQFLRAKKNIATTHELFRRFDAETKQLIADGEYTLIIDEVVDSVSVYDITAHDAKIILNTFVDVDDVTGHLSWRQGDEEQKYFGKFIDYKEDCDNDLLWRYGDTTIIKMIPSDVFRIFDEVFVMTYMFDCQIQRCYFDYFGISYRYLYVDGDSLDTYHITEEEREYKISGIKDKIHICYDRDLNAIGLCRTDLSRGWYENKDNEESVRLLKNNVTTFLRRRVCATKDSALWTCYKEHPKPGDHNREYGSIFTPKSYAKSFLSCNARATNAYKDRKYLAYAVNIFLSPVIKNFFTMNGIEIDENKWALSTMIQWIWRGAIRQGKDVWLYVPSKRMRTLLEEWIDQISDDTNKNECEETAEEAV